MDLRLTAYVYLIATDQFGLQAVFPFSSFSRQQDVMISDTTLTSLANGLGVTAMLLVVAYHFVAVNAGRAQD